MTSSKRRLPQSWAAPAPETSIAEDFPTDAIHLPELTFNKGRIKYAFTAVEAEYLCQRLLASSITALGFDIEWRVTFKAGQVPCRAALLQLCYFEPGSQIYECLLLQIRHTGLTPSLRQLLERADILKAGVGINGDAMKLTRDYGIQMKGLVCLGEQADLRMKSTDRHGRSLADLAVDVLGKTLNKDPNIRLSNWETLPLSMEQQHYAATDAYASLRICQVLGTMPKIVRTPVPAPLRLSESTDPAMPDESVAAAAVLAPLQPAKLALYCTVVEEGNSLEAAAAAKKVQLCTVDSYLAEAVLAGYAYSWSHLGLSASALYAVADALQKLLASSPSPEGGTADERATASAASASPEGQQLQQAGQSESARVHSRLEVRRQHPIRSTTGACQQLSDAWRGS
ncbi:hypothetical protein WJX73_001238 [Symbiochloris irregularis]|uniref:3'-5' exonuclease n=1 Tax=Symbiochloris irregularis TaxID=706552 RepID=A0AAW1Q270_9CHLO